MDYKNLLKKYWFLLIVALGLIVFVAFYISDEIKNREVVVNTKQVDGQYLLYSVDDLDYTADELYDELKNMAVSGYSITNGEMYLANAYIKNVCRSAIETTSDMSTYASNYVSYLLYYYDNDELDSMLKSYGYANGVDEVSDYIIDMLKQQEMMTTYYTDNFDTVVGPIVNEKSPRIVSHILVKVADITSSTDANGNTTYIANMSDEEKEKLENVKAEIAKGTDFAQIAMDYSDDGTASTGGYLGVLTNDNSSNYVSDFFNAAMEAEYDVITDAVLTQYGYHFILVKEADTESLLSDSSFLSTLSETYPNIEFLACKALAEKAGFTIEDADFAQTFESICEDCQNEISNYGKEVNE